MGDDKPVWLPAHPKQLDSWQYAQPGIIYEFMDDESLQCCTGLQALTNYHVVLHNETSNAYPQCMLGKDVTMKLYTKGAKCEGMSCPGFEKSIFPRGEPNNMKPGVTADVYGLTEKCCLNYTHDPMHSVCAVEAGKSGVCI